MHNGNVKTINRELSVLKLIENLKDLDFVPEADLYLKYFGQYPALRKLLSIDKKVKNKRPGASKGSCSKGHWITKDHHHIFICE